MLFNSLYGKIARTDEKIGQMIAKGGLYEDNDILRCLCDDGFLYVGDIDETAMANVKRMDLIMNNYLHLNLMPTYACNFRCKYCYENNPSRDDNFLQKSMSDSLQESLISFIKKKISLYSGLMVEWYGGEPFQ